MTLTRLFETDTHVFLYKSTKTLLSRIPLGGINRLVFIAYYISYTGANMDPNGNITPNKQIIRVCFLFSLAKYTETCERECDY